MRVLRLAAVQSFAAIGAAAVAIGLLTAPAASAATATASPTTTVTPPSEVQRPPCCSLYGHFTFTGVVTNNGPDAASPVTVTVTGYTTTLAFSAPKKTGCTQSGATYTCAKLPAGASITVAIGITRVVLGAVVSGGFTVIGSDGTNTSSAGGGWTLYCWRYPGNCGI
jgi:hypothetical protein